MFHEKESQFEMFPGTSTASDYSQPTRFLSRRFMISLEGLFVASMVVAIGMLVAFSLGVERGKRINAVVKNIPAPLRTQTVDAARIPSPSPAAVPEKGVMNTTNAANSKSWSNPLDVASLNDHQSVRQEPVPRVVIPDTVDNVEEPEDTKKNIDKSYTVQVASFKNQEYAEKEAMDLKKSGYEPFILPKGSHLIVCIGKFATKNEAEKFSVKLKSKYKDSVIRSL